VRRLLLVNALIFAVLAAAVALAFYGFSYTSEVSFPESEKALIYAQAEDHITEIEDAIVQADTKLFGDIQLDPLSDLNESVKRSRAAVSSVFVLDENLELVPGGYLADVTTHPQREATAFRDWFMKEVLPRLPLKTQKTGTRGHVHDRWKGKPFLFSFVKKQAGERTYYIVVEDDQVHLVAFVFSQFFQSRPPLVYQVVDENGVRVYGPPFVNYAGSHVVEVPFVDTVDHWVVRVSEDIDPGPARRRRIIDLFMIGGAVTVIVTGVVLFVLAIRRERRANELKSDFISNVSHELKTPLSIISMFGEMLAAGRTKSPEQATEYAEIIWRESVRLGRLIDNVLDFAKIERGMGVYEFADADIAEVVTRAIEVPQRRLATAEMTLDTDIEDDVPPVRLDANAFTLAVLNLIDNAIKYAPEGKRIELSLRRDGDRVVLAVQDWGPGIDPAEHEAIFDRFYRARAIRLKPIRGSGIGLALVRHIARAHGGDVDVESAPGTGATFRLWVPIGDRT
jgi:two-component system phosphate regulon sensor histidine kinase PhoR